MKLMTLAAAVAMSVVLSSAGAALAASTGGGEVTGKAGKFSLGVEYDNMFNRDMKFKSGAESISNILVFTNCNCSSQNYPASGGTIDGVEAKSRKFLAKGTIGVHERVDVFVRVGMASFDFEYKYKSPGYPDGKIEFEGDYGFAYGAGITGKILDTSSGLKLAGTAQYMQYKSDGTYKVNGKDFASYVNLFWNTTGSTYTSNVEVTEWHAAVIVSKDLDRFVPYGGVKYSNLEFEYTLDLKGTYIGTGPYSYKQVGKAESDKNIGVFGGADFKINDNISANAEVRLLDETAASVGASFRF